MEINQYDKDGRTPLMNAAIDGNLDEVKRLLKVGADPDMADKIWGSSKASDFAARKSNSSEPHKQILSLLLASSKSSEHRMDNKMDATTQIINGKTSSPQIVTSWPYETVLAVTGNYVTRLKSSLFYWAAAASLTAGIALLYGGKVIGGSVIVTLTPGLLLYPLVRLLFGGKDSLAAAVTTVVIEEVIKSKMRETSNKSRRRR